MERGETERRSPRVLMGDGAVRRELNGRRAMGAQAGALAAALLWTACTRGGAALPGPTDRPTGTGPGGAGVAFTSPLAISGADPFRACPGPATVTRASEVEPSVAVDPDQPSFAVAAWQQNRNTRGAAQGIVAATSSDGGRTWGPAALPRLTRCTGGPYPLASDPVVSIGTDRTYLLSIAVRATARRTRWS